MKENNLYEKSSNFKRNIIIYIAILAILCFIFLMYVMNTLYQYENSFSNNYMNEVVNDISKSAKKGKLPKFCNADNLYLNNLEKSGTSYGDGIKEIFETSNITYKLNDENKSDLHPVYNIYANDEKIMSVTLNVEKQVRRLGLFSYPVWKVENCNLEMERGLYYYDISVPSNYTVKVNGTQLDDKYISKTTSNENYEKMSQYVKLPNMVNYKLDNFVNQPEIKIFDNNGNDINYNIKNHQIEIQDSYITANNYNEAKNNLAKEIDILDIAEKWSLFLTNDLKGNLHGFNTINQYLIKGSSFYDMAYAWATSVDITFVSSHTLKNPTFTNTSLSDFVIYNKNAFSCTVYLEKNMKIANGNDKVDVMHDTLYFVYYDDTNDNVDNPTWKLVDMKSVTEN